MAAVNLKLKVTVIHTTDKRTERAIGVWSRDPTVTLVSAVFVRCVTIFVLEKSEKKKIIFEKRNRKFASRLNWIEMSS